jgi:hypothetical protein
LTGDRIWSIDDFSLLKNALKKYARVNLQWSACEIADVLTFCFSVFVSFCRRPRACPWESTSSGMIQEDFFDLFYYP